MDSKNIFESKITDFSFDGATIKIMFSGKMITVDTPSSFKNVFAFGNLTPIDKIQKYGNEEEFVCWHGPTKSFYLKYSNWNHIKKYIKNGIILDNPQEITYNEYQILCS